MSAVERGFEYVACRLVEGDEPHVLNRLTWLYHPYDGGADVIARYKGERDMLMRRHSNWLPANAYGL